MIDRPTKFPDWALTNVIDPTEQTPNVVEPPNEKKQVGWIPHEVVPNNWLNWIHKTSNDWLKYLDSKVTTPSLVSLDKPLASDVSVGTIIHINNLNEGGTMAFSDGTHWRKISDNSIITE